MRKIYLILAIVVAALNLRPLMTSAAPLLATIQSHLGMSGTAASLLTTLPVLCMGLFAPLAAGISGRIGLERTIWAALLLITGMTALRGIGESVSLLIVTAVAGGIGISLAGPLLSAFIKKYFPAHPAVVSVYSAAMTAGAALSSGLSVPLYERSGQHLPFALAIWALPGLAALLIWAALARRRSESAARKPYALPLRSRQARRLTLFFGLMAGIFYSVTAWIAPIAVSLGYTPGEAAVCLTVFALIQIPVSLIVPGIVAKFGQKRIVLLLCSTFELAGIVLLLAGAPALLAAVSLGLGAGGLFPLALMLPIAEAKSPEEAGGWAAMTQGGGYVIGALGPLAIGLLHDAAGTFAAPLSLLLVMIAAMMGLQWKMTGGANARRAD